jgi:DNA-binding MarR family transcriptional regulator
MPNISKWDEVVKSHEGKPMEVILTEAYDQYDGQTAVAEHLGVSQGTISLWLKILGLKEKATLVKRETKQPEKALTA